MLGVLGLSMPCDPSPRPMGSSSGPRASESNLTPHQPMVSPSIWKLMDPKNLILPLLFLQPQPPLQFREQRVLDPPHPLLLL